MSKIFAAMILALGAIPVHEAFAANWKPLGIASLNGVNFIDSVDISTLKQRDGAIIEIWTRSEFIAVQPLPSDPGKQFKAVNELTVYNCKDQTKAIQTETYFDNAGHVIRQISVPVGHLSFTAVETDTVGELEMKYVCRMHFI